MREAIIRGVKEREERGGEVGGQERDTQDLLMYIRLLSLCGRVQVGLRVCACACACTCA